MKTIHGFLIILLVIAGWSVSEYNASAVPARPGPVTVRQPDGTSLTIRAYGDEWAHYFTTDDGYGIKKGADGFFYYLGSNDEMLSVRAKNVSVRTSADRAAMSGVPVGVPYSRLEGERRDAIAKASAHSGRLSPQIFDAEAPVAQGKHPTLVMIVDFPDKKFTMSDPMGYYDRLLNGRSFTEGGATGSVWQYYYDNSAGKFDPEFVLSGVYHAPRSYESWDTGNGAAELLIWILQQMIDSGYDFGRYLDANGEIHDVCMIFAGEFGYVNGGLWPHTMPWFESNIGGVFFDTYSINCELDRDSSFMGIGVFTHEYGHVIGLPDFYNTQSTGGLTPYYYCTMDLGCYNNDSRTPPAMTVINRYIMGWIEPITLEEKGQYELPAIGNSNEGYLIRISGEGNRGEYFTFETRSADTNVWDGGLGYNGLLVMHIDRTPEYVDLWDLDRFNNYVNTDPYHPCGRPVLAIENEIPWTEVEVMENYWLFPGMTEVTALSEDTHNSFKAWDRTPHLKELYNIAYSNGKITFDYNDNASQGWSGEIEEDYVYQNDALFSWGEESDVSISGYNVEVLYGADEVVFSKTVGQPEVYIPYLTPDTEYNLKISAMNGDDLVSEQEIAFHTLPLAGEFAYIAVEGVYGKDESVPLHIFDVQGTLESIEWQVDGTEVVPPAVTLSAGRHKIAVRVKTTDGNEEIITKFVTIR